MAVGVDAMKHVDGDEAGAFARARGDVGRTGGVRRRERAWGGVDEGAREGETVFAEERGLAARGARRDVRRVGAAIDAERRHRHRDEHGAPHDGYDDWIGEESSETFVRAEFLAFGVALGVE